MKVVEAHRRIWAVCHPDARRNDLKWVIRARSRNGNDEKKPVFAIIFDVGTSFPMLLDQDVVWSIQRKDETGLHDYISIAHSVSNLVDWTKVMTRRSCAQGKLNNHHFTVMKWR